MLKRTRLESMRNRIIDFEKEIEERIRHEIKLNKRAEKRLEVKKAKLEAKKVILEAILEAEEEEKRIRRARSLRNPGPVDPYIRICTYA